MRCPRVRPADASAGGSSSLSKRGAEKLAGIKRAAKAKKAKAAKRAKADREDESDSDCPSILEMILRVHCKRGSDSRSDSESEPECGSESDSDESDD